MEPVGELYGSSFDAILRRPRSVLVPLLAEGGIMAIAALTFPAVLGTLALVPLSRRAAGLPFSVPGALPSAGDVIAAPAWLPETTRGLAALVLFAILLLPLLAYAEAGFLGVLNRRFLIESEEDPLRAREDWTFAELRAAFEEEARRHFAPILALRAFLTGTGVLALALPEGVPYARNYALGTLVIQFVLLYAPYAVVREGLGPLDAVRASFTAIADYLATSLVALLFLLLTTGGVSALLAPLAAHAGAWAPVVALVLYVPVGAALSLFVMRLHARMRPREALPAAAPARADRPAVEGA